MLLLLMKLNQAEWRMTPTELPVAAAPTAHSSDRQHLPLTPRASVSRSLPICFEPADRLTFCGQRRCRRADSARSSRSCCARI